MAERKGIQLAEPFSERRLFNQGRYRSTWSPPWAVQRKLDGERCRAIVSDGRCLLLSSSEEIISSVPHINHYFIDHFPDGEYDGELYIHGWNQSQVHSVVSTITRLHPKAEQMEFHLFDIKTTMIQAGRLLRIKDLPYGGPIKSVEAFICNTMPELLSLYDRFIDEGYEGFIIRELSSLYVERRSQMMMKFKPKQKDHYEILSVYEAFTEDNKPKGMVGGFECRDDMGTVFRVGAGKLTHGKRCRMWEDVISGRRFKGMILEVEYQTMSSKNKVPLFSRAVKIIELLP